MTDRTKTICPPIFDLGGKKIKIKFVDINHLRFSKKNVQIWKGRSFQDLKLIIYFEHNFHRRFIRVHVVRSFVTIWK